MRNAERAVMKKTFYTEAAYILGIAAIALGTVLMEASDFGVSMVVAPAYLLYLELSGQWSFFTFGMAEVMLQVFLLLLLWAVTGRFKLSYLFSFVTAALYGLILDGFMALFAFVPVTGLAARLACFAAGMLACSLGVSLVFHTYITPEAYELFVREIASRFGFDIHRVKTVYDCSSCLAAVIMSFAFFGFGVFRGVKLGTVFCALVNGYIISLFTRGLEKRFTFGDALPLRKLFV